MSAGFHIHDRLCPHGIAGDETADDRIDPTQAGRNGSGADEGSDEHKRIKGRDDLEGQKTDTSGHSVFTYVREHEKKQETDKINGHETSFYFKL